MPVSLRESSDFASLGALWKYDSHAACHMRPPTLLWDIDPLFIEVARPMTLGLAQTFSFDQPPPPPLLKSPERAPTHAGHAGEGGRVPVSRKERETETETQLDRKRKKRRKQAETRG